MNMVSNALTVSFASYSCEVSGFDNPFAIMRGLVGYFQSLTEAAGADGEVIADATDMIETLNPFSDGVALGVEIDGHSIRVRPAPRPTMQLVADDEAGADRNDEAEDEDGGEAIATASIEGDDEAGSVDRAETEAEAEIESDAEAEAAELVAEADSDAATETDDVPDSPIVIEGFADEDDFEITPTDDVPALLQAAAEHTTPEESLARIAAEAGDEEADATFERDLTALPDTGTDDDVPVMIVPAPGDRTPDALDDAADKAAGEDGDDAAADVEALRSDQAAAEPESRPEDDAPLQASAGPADQETDTTGEAELPVTAPEVEVDDATAPADTATSNTTDEAERAAPYVAAVDMEAETDMASEPTEDSTAAEAFEAEGDQTDVIQEAPAEAVNSQDEPEADAKPQETLADEAPAAEVQAEPVATAGAATPSEASGEIAAQTGAGDTEPGAVASEAEVAEDPEAEATAKSAATPEQAAADGGDEPAEARVETSETAATAPESGAQETEAAAEEPRSEEHEPDGVEADMALAADAGEPDKSADETFAESETASGDSEAETAAAEACAEEPDSEAVAAEAFAAAPEGEAAEAEAVADDPQADDTAFEGTQPEAAGEDVSSDVAARSENATQERAVADATDRTDRAGDAAAVPEDAIEAEQAGTEPTARADWTEIEAADAAAPEAESAAEVARPAEDDEVADAAAPAGNADDDVEACDAVAENDDSPDPTEDEQQPASPQDALALHDTDGQEDDTDPAPELPETLHAQSDVSEAPAAEAVPDPEEVTAEAAPVAPAPDLEDHVQGGGQDEETDLRDSSDEIEFLSETTADEAAGADRNAVPEAEPARHPDNVAARAIPAHEIEAASLLDQTDEIEFAASGLLSRAEPRDTAAMADALEKAMAALEAEEEEHHDAFEAATKASEDLPTGGEESADPDPQPAAETRRRPLIIRRNDGGGEGSTEALLGLDEDDPDPTDDLADDAEEPVAAGQADTGAERLAPDAGAIEARMNELGESIRSEIATDDRTDDDDDDDEAVDDRAGEDEAVAAEPMDAPLRLEPAAPLVLGTPKPAPLVLGAAEKPAALRLTAKADEPAASGRPAPLRLDPAPEAPREIERVEPEAGHHADADDGEEKSKGMFGSIGRFLGRAPALRTESDVPEPEATPEPTPARQAETEPSPREARPAMLNLGEVQRTEPKRTLRVVGSDAADSDDGDVQVVDDEEADATSLRGLARRVGAESLPELLEVSAAYLCLIDHQPRFSRASLFTKVAEIGPAEGYTAEARIKSFGKLLRSGKILRAENGQFAISDSVMSAYRTQIGL